MVLSLVNARPITQAEIRVMTLNAKRWGASTCPGRMRHRGAAAGAGAGRRLRSTRASTVIPALTGSAELRQAIAAKMQDYNGINADPETEITVSAGSTGAFYCACLALLDPGDEVVLFEPYYGYHLNTIEAVGAVGAFVRMRPPDWTFDAATTWSER